MAAEQGHDGAQYNLGICYLKGRGVTNDNGEGLRWIAAAARQGNADARKALELLKK